MTSTRLCKWRPLQLGGFTVHFPQDQTPVCRSGKVEYYMQNLIHSRLTTSFWHVPNEVMACEIAFGLMRNSRCSVVVRMKFLRQWAELYRSITQRSPLSLFQNEPRDHSPGVMMYISFPLSLRNVEDLLRKRVIHICNESVLS